MATNFFAYNNFIVTPVGPVIPVISNPVYEPRAIFSINASNLLQGTFWIVKDGVQLTTGIGTATYVIRDQDGVTIGLTESGLTADANGFFYITPALADSIQDLTHYTVEITIIADTLTRKGVVGITLGE